MRNGVTLLDLGIVVAPVAVAVVLLVVAVMQRGPAPTPGWRQVTPGVGYWLAALLSAALSGLIAWVWAYVGSSRPDGEIQMHIAWWLSLLFGAGALYASLRIVSLYRLRLCWRGDKLRWANGPAVPMTELLSLSHTLLGFTRVTFRSGQCLRIDASASGAAALVERIEELNGLAPEDGPGEH